MSVHSSPANIEHRLRRYVERHPSVNSFEMEPPLVKDGASEEVVKVSDDVKGWWVRLG